MGGYFWISYEDTTLNVENDSQAEVTFYDVEPANRYEYNYQYDSKTSSGTMAVTLFLYAENKSDDGASSSSTIPCQRESDAIVA